MTTTPKTKSKTNEIWKKIYMHPIEQRAIFFNMEKDLTHECGKDE